MALTRSQVARRLRKSIATVRRLEQGGELNPEQSYNGVHLFDEREVADLAARFAARERIPAARSRWLQDFPAAQDPSTRPRQRPPKDNPRRLDELQRENDDLRHRLKLARSAVELWLEQGPTEEVIDALRLAL